MNIAQEERLVRRISIEVAKTLLPMIARPTAPGEEPLTVQDLSRQFRCGRLTIYRMMKNPAISLRPIRPIKPYLFHPAEVFRVQQLKTKKHEKQRNAENHRSG